MPDGTEISGVAGLQAELLRKETLFLTALTEKLFTYGLGRVHSILLCRLDANRGSG